MDRLIVNLTDVNENICERRMESRTAGAILRQLRSSSSEVLTNLTDVNGSTDHGNTGPGEPRTAGAAVRQLRSSSSEVLTNSTDAKGGIGGKRPWEPHSAGVAVRQIMPSASETIAVDRNNEIRVATWNVRTLRRAGKLENVKAEMKRMKINIMGVCETRWPGEGDFFSEEYRVIHSGKEGGQGGVGVILDKRTANAVTGVRYEGERLMMVKLRGKPVDIVVIQVYMPTSEHKDEAIEEMYERIEELMDKETKGKDYTVIMGDWNAVVGEVREGRITGK